MLIEGLLLLIIFLVCVGIGKISDKDGNKEKISKSEEKSYKFSPDYINFKARYRWDKEEQKFRKK